MNNSLVFTTLIGLAALMGAGAAHAQQASGEPIKVGAVVSATGGGAVVGVPERNGILLGQKFINSNGGINGRPLQIIVDDDGSSPDAAVTKVNNLVFSQNVKAILGNSMIANTVATGGITAPLNLPQVAYSGIGPAVESQRTCLFHLLPPQELNARALLEYATKGLNAKKLGVLHDSGYGNVVMGALKGLAAEFDVNFVAVEKFEISATDTSTQAAKVKAQTPDAVIIIASSATPFRNAKQVKITVPIIGAIASSSYESVKAMGEAADNIVFAEFVIAEDPLPNQKKFVEEYSKEYGVPPKNYEAAGFDSVVLLSNALRKVAADADNQTLCNAIRTTYQGVLGLYDFKAPDMTGLTLASYSYSKLVNGKFTRVLIPTSK
jgi:branched-chain amino acid transport system substrate-binding protein